MSWKDHIDDLRKRRDMAKRHGGPDAVARQHSKGKLALRERIDALLDKDSFREQGEAAGFAEYDDKGNLTDFQPANYVLGTGQVDGRRVVIGGEDFTLRGGSPNAAGLRKSVYAEDLALQYKLPLIRLLEGGGGSVRGSSGKGLSYSPVYERPRFLSIARVVTEVPVAAAAVGAVAGFPAARLAASHFSVMTRETSQVLVAGPAVVERALGVKISKEDLGGPNVHLKNGVVDNLAADEQDAFAQIRQFLSYLPSNVHELPPVVPCDDPVDRADDKLLDLIPTDRRKAYDGRRLIKLVVDTDSFFEMGRQYGPGQIVGLARLGGRPVGVWGGDCRFAAAAMTAAGAQKVRRFIDLCNVFHLPIVAFVDEPGFMIGPDAEKAGTIRYGTTAVVAAMQSRVPWASVIVRKNYGVAAAAHYSEGALVLAWPSAEMGALPIEGGVAIAFGKEIAEAEDPDAKRKELEDMLAVGQSPVPRSEAFAIHELIDPRETRARLNDWLDLSWPLLEHQRGPTSFGIRP